MHCGRAGNQESGVLLYYNDGAPPCSDMLTGWDAVVRLEGTDAHTARLEVKSMAFEMS